MNDRLHAGISAMTACFVGATLLVRWAVTGGEPSKHRSGRRPRRADLYVPACFLVPAQRVIALCDPCGREVPVTVHGADAYRCDRQHLTIHTTTGSTL